MFRHLRNRKGMVGLVILIVELLITFAMFGAMIYDMRDGVGPNERVTADH